MLVVLCRNRSNSSAALAVRCSALLNPQSANSTPTTVHVVLHNPACPRTATRPCCPQIAHPLILILRSLRCFFFEVHPWGHSLGGVHGPPPNQGCRRSRLAFKLAREALRLLFDRRCGRRGESSAIGVPSRESPTPAGELGTLETHLGEGTQWTRLLHGLSPT